MHFRFFKGNSTPTILVNTSILWIGQDFFVVTLTSLIAVKSINFRVISANYVFKAEIVAPVQGKKIICSPPRDYRRAKRSPSALN